MTFVPEFIILALGVVLILIIRFLKQNRIHYLIQLATAVSLGVILGFVVSDELGMFAFLGTLYLNAAYFILLCYLLLTASDSLLSLKTLFSGRKVSPAMLGRLLLQSAMALFSLFLILMGNILPVLLACGFILLYLYTSITKKQWAITVNTLIKEMASIIYKLTGKLFTCLPYGLLPISASLTAGIFSFFFTPALWLIIALCSLLLFYREHFTPLPAQHLN